jgi:magnesium transporter
MPELHLKYGFYGCIGVMLVADLALWWRFKRAGWL